MSNNFDDFHEDTDRDELPNPALTKESSGILLTLYDYRRMHIFRIRYKNARDPLWTKSSTSLAPFSQSLWASFLADPDSDSLLRLSNTEIRSRCVEMSGFFIALANTLRCSVILDEVSVRDSQQPSTSSQVSSYEPVLHATDDDLEEMREKAKRVSSRLASEFISLVMDIFFEQPSDLKKRLAFKLAPTRFDIINNDNTVHCKCFDNGSIVWHEKDQSSKEWRLGSHICSVETKPIFTKSDEEGKEKISLQTIPQYACEMIGAIMQRLDKESLDMSADHWQPLIVTHSCYITFLSTTFHPMYLKYIMGDGKELDGEPPFLDIYCTKTHDLKTSAGRKNAAEDLLGLCEKLKAGNSTGEGEEGDDERDRESDEKEEEEIGT